MKTAENNKEIKLDEREKLPQRICDTLRQKRVNPDSIVHQQLVIWLDCNETMVYRNYDCKDYRVSICSYLNENGGYLFDKVIFRQGKPGEEAGATRIGDNDREWITIEDCQGFEDKPIQASVRAGRDFKLAQDEYILSPQDLEERGIFHYNIGRGNNNGNQIVFDEEHENNKIIGRDLAYIEFNRGENCLCLVGRNTAYRSIGTVSRNGEQKIGRKIVLEDGDRIIMTIVKEGDTTSTTRTILLYSENRVVDNSENRVADLPTGTTRIKGPEVFKQLKKEFKEWMKSESFGKSLIYPVSIYVYMNCRDFQENQDRIHMWVPPIVATLYRVIKWKVRSLEIGPRMGHGACELVRRFIAWTRKKVYVPKEFNSPVIYLPHRRKWFFQFISCEIGPENEQIRQGKVKIHFNCNVPSAEEVIPEKPRIYMVGIPTKVEKGKKVDVSKDELSAIQVADQLAYFIPFDEKLQTNEANIQRTLEDHRKGKRIYATITMTEGNQPHEWSMSCDRITISGSHDTRNQNDLIKLPTPNVQDNHVIIQYVEKDKKFEVAAWGRTTLNGNEMIISTGTTPEWVELPNESRLILNNDIDIQFRARL